MRVYVRGYGTFWRLLTIRLIWFEIYTSDCSGLFCSYFDIRFNGFVSKELKFLPSVYWSIGVKKDIT